MYRESYFCTKMNRVAWGWGGDSAIDKGAIFGVGRVVLLLIYRESYFWTR